MPWASLHPLPISLFSVSSAWQIDGETIETVTDFIFLGSKITVDGDCSHEIKRCWLLGSSSVELLSCVRLYNAMDCSTSGFPVHHHLLKPAQTHVHWVDDAIRPSCPLFFPSPLRSIFPSITVFSNELALHIRWPNYWISNLSISSSIVYSGLISFKID